MEKQSKIAIIRIRGGIGIEQGIKNTLVMLKLYRKNYCVVEESNPSLLGMLKKVKDYVTWGEISEECLKKLTEKRSEKAKGKDGKESEKGFFRLSPPRKGYGRKGIKVSFKTGGALGYRAENINDLIIRMV